jgi:glycosyltransferase involved in cell wall biosynthesis
MGSGFATAKAKRLSKFASEEEIIMKQIKIKGKKAREIYPPYTIYALSRIIMSLEWILKILSINKKSKITLIHAQDTKEAGLAAVVSGKILGIPVILSSHGIQHKKLETSMGGKLKRLFVMLQYKLDIFTVQNADSVIAVNRLIKNYFEHIVSKKIDVIPIPIKLMNFEFSWINRDLVRKELGMDKKTKVIGFVGRFEPEKNLFNLLASFADLAKENTWMYLVLVGTGSLESQLRLCVRKRGIENRVIFCGVRYDIGRILSSFDIFVLPSYVEGLSTALLEAMTSGRAIICSDIPANRELVTHNKEGLLINPYDTVGLKQAIHLLANDFSLCSRLGYNAKLRSKQFDESIVFPKIMDYYEALLAKQKIA